MKFLTLNTHSWMENDSLDKLEDICKAVLYHRFDIIALQEVNQSISASEVNPADLKEFTAANGDHPIKKDNFAFLLQKKLAEKGLHYYWTWDASHIGYDRYDEGLALLSLQPIQNAHSFFVSENTAYDDYKSRKVIGIQSANAWYFSLHLGWWDDAHDPFREQWQRCTNMLEQLKSPVFLLGDFNNPDHRQNEGYELVSQNWFDTYLLAEQKDAGYTVAKSIDGWTDNEGGLRIDYIFASFPVSTRSSKVIFNGANEPVVSDHFGVAVEISNH